MTKNRLPIRIGIVKNVEFCADSLHSICLLFTSRRTDPNWVKRKTDPHMRVCPGSVIFCFRNCSDMPLAHSQA